MRMKFWCACMVLLAGSFAISHAGDVDVARQKLDGLRNIQLPEGPDSDKRIEALNKKMDATWGFFDTHKASLAVAEDELRKAVAAKDADQFFLLDIAYLLISKAGASDAELAVSALERVEPKAEIIQANWNELFFLSMKVGESAANPERYLAQMDRIYLPDDRGVEYFRAPHYVKLDALDMMCMVYGVVGESAAAHLRGFLGMESSDRVTILRVLGAVGSEDDTPAVKAVLDKASDFKLVSACVTFLMEIGGPSGQAAVLGLDSTKMDAESKKYLGQIYSSVEGANFATLSAPLLALDPKTVDDAELQRLLDQMEERNGDDNETPPGAPLKSQIPKDHLLAQLKRIRARSYRRETNHVFEDLPIFTGVINALQYK